MKQTLLIILFICSAILLLGCTENVPSPPVTEGQILRYATCINSATDLNNYKHGFFDGNLVFIDVNKLCFVAPKDLNLIDANIPWSTLINFPSGCGVNQAVKIVGSSLVCVDLNSWINTQNVNMPDYNVTAGFFVGSGALLYDVNDAFWKWCNSDNNTICPKSGHGVEIAGSTTVDYCQGTPTDTVCQNNYFNQADCDAFGNHYGDCLPWVTQGICNGFNYYGACSGSDTYEATCLSYGNDPTCNFDPLCQYDGSTQCDSVAFVNGCQAAWNNDEFSCQASGCTWTNCVDALDQGTCDGLGMPSSQQCLWQDTSFCPDNTGLSCLDQGVDAGACAVVGGCSFASSPLYSFLKANILVSDVNTGVPPMQVASTTTVSNLSADMVDGQHSSAFQPVGNYQAQVTSDGNYWWGFNGSWINALSTIATFYLKTGGEITRSLADGSVLVTLTGTRPTSGLNMNLLAMNTIQTLFAANEGVKATFAANSNPLGSISMTTPNAGTQYDTTVSITAYGGAQEFSTATIRQNNSNQVWGGFNRKLNLDPYMCSGDYNAVLSATTGNAGLCWWQNGAPSATFPRYLLANTAGTSYVRWDSASQITIANSNGSTASFSGLTSTGLNSWCAYRNTSTSWQLYKNGVQQGTTQAIATIGSIVFNYVGGNGSSVLGVPFDEVVSGINSNDIGTALTTHYSLGYGYYYPAGNRFDIYACDEGSGTALTDIGSSPKSGTFQAGSSWVASTVAKSMTSQTPQIFALFDGNYGGDTGGIDAGNLALKYFLTGSSIDLNSQRTNIKDAVGTGSYTFQNSDLNAVIDKLDANNEFSVTSQQKYIDIPTYALAGNPMTSNGGAGITLGKVHTIAWWQEGGVALNSLIVNNGGNQKIRWDGAGNLRYYVTIGTVVTFNGQNPSGQTRYMISRNGTAVTLYKNGVSQGTANLTSNLDFNIDNFFDATIDANLKELDIWSDAKSQAFATTDYASGAGKYYTSTSPNILYAWHMTEGSGSTVTDAIASKVITKAAGNYTWNLNTAISQSTATTTVHVIDVNDNLTAVGAKPIVYVGDNNAFTEVRGLIYCSFKGDNIDRIVTIPDTNNYHEVDGNLSLAYQNGCVFQNNKEFRILYSGYYDVAWNISGSTSGANDQLEGEVLVNGVHDENGGSAHCTTQNSNKPCNISSVGIVHIDSNGLVSLGVRNVSATNNVVINHANLVAKRIAD